MLQVTGPGFVLVQQFVVPVQQIHDLSLLLIPAWLLVHEWGLCSIFFALQMIHKQARMSEMCPTLQATQPNPPIAFAKDD
jgi:hypothetical protein